MGGCSCARPYERGFWRRMARHEDRRRSIGPVSARVAGELERVGNRAWREVVARVPPVSWAVNQRYDRRLREHRDHLAPLPPMQQRLLDTVSTSGVAITSLDMLGLPGISSLKDSLARLAAGLAAHPSTETSPVRSSRAELLQELDVWQWGLREDVLDLVEGCLQLPARYYGADVRRELANGQQATVRQWHRDIEDHRVFRVFVWIDDVGPMDGAFEWIPRELTGDTTRALHYVAGYKTEDQIANVVAPTLWKKADGPRWTAILADTHSVFHRAGTPRNKDRYSVTFTWTSRWPVKTFPSKPFSPDEAAKIQSGLNSRQLASLPPGLSH